MIVEGGLFYTMSYPTPVSSQVSKNWPITTATINTSYVNAQAGEEGDLYALKLLNIDFNT